GRPIRGVAELLDRSLHALPGLWTDFRVATKDTRHCHRSNADMPGHFVHRHSAPTTSCFCIFHGFFQLALCRHYLPYYALVCAHDTVTDQLVDSFYPPTPRTAGY